MARADWKKWLKRIILAFVFLLFLTSAIILSIEIVPTDKSLLKGLEEIEEMALMHVVVDDRDIRCLQYSNQDTNAVLLVFVHGAPGGASAFKSYFKDGRLRASFHMLSYDRPGYSREAKGDSEPDISVQGRLLAELVRLTVGSAKGVILVSHSFGGPIAAMAADELGEVVIGHVMIAPVISPQCEPDFWYSSIPHTFPFTLFSSHGWKVASTEKRFHREYLKETTHVWQDISYEVIHFHGSDDWLAPIENVHFAEASIPERWYHPVILEGKSHFILWTEREQITREILRLAERN